MSEAREGLAWWQLAAVALLALVLRVVCVAQYEAGHPLADRPVIDEASYDSWAREIATGDVLGREIFFQEPLYPYALGGVYALAGDSPKTQRSVARYAQAALGALTCALIALLAARVFGKGAGLLAGFLWAIYAPAIWFSALLLKPNLFLPLLAAFLLRLTDARRLRDWLLVGVLAALGALLRGNMLVLLPFVVAWPLASALAQRRSKLPAIGASLCVALGVALTLAPVVLRNHHVGGRFVLTTSGAGTNFYGGNNLDNPYGVATEFDWVRGIPEHEAGDWRREASRRAGRELDATETSSFWMRAALDSMVEHPLEHLTILWRKFRLALNRYETPDNHFFDWDARYVGVLRGSLPGFGVVGLLGLLGVVLIVVDRMRRLPSPTGAAQLMVFFALYLGTIVATVMSDRARLPLALMLAPFAGWALVGVAQGWRATKRGVLLALPVLAAVVWLVQSPAMPAERAAQDFDERDHNLAVNLLAENDLAAVAPIVERLVARHEGAARVNLLAAEFEYRSARVQLDAAPRGQRIPPEAASKLESAFQRLENVARRGSAQERFRAQALAGAMHQYFGAWKKAEDSYRAALAFDPTDRDLRRRLAVVVAEYAVLLPTGTARAQRIDEAIAVLEALLAESEDLEVRSLLERVRATPR